MVTESERQPLVCRRCRLPIEIFTHPDGAVQHLHSRAWEKHDHEPDPIQAAVGDARLSCDFCGAGNPVFQYEGDEVGYRVSAGFELGSSLGTRWAGCAECDPLIRRCDIEALLDRHFASPAQRQVDARLAEEFEPGLAAVGREVASRDFQRRLLASYVRSIRRRSLIPPPPPPPVKLVPARLPKVRDRLVDVWSQTYPHLLTGPIPADEAVMLPGADLDDCDDFQAPSSDVRPAEAARFCRRMANAAQTAELFWVSADFTKLAIRAARRLPDLTVSRQEMPATSGLIVYADPIDETSIPNGGKSLIVAMGWTVVPGGVWLTEYAQPEQVLPTVDRDQLRKEFGFLLPVAPGAGITFGSHRVGEEQRQLPGYSVWAALLSTWFLMAQPGVAAVQEQKPDRKAARSAARAGRSAPTVRVVDLRRRPARVRPAGSASGSRVITKRSLVGWETDGFWRDQAYGPQWSLRKRLWIDPFIRGPDGAPFAHEVAPVVKVLR